MRDRLKRMMDASDKYSKEKIQKAVQAPLVATCILTLIVASVLELVARVILWLI